MRKLALALAALLPLAARAGGYAVPNVNPRDLGMAGSVVAAQNSAAAVFVNPAALARLPGLRVSAAATVLDNRSTWTDTFAFFANGADEISTDVNPAYPPALYVSYGGEWDLDRGAEGGWGIGAGFTIPAGGNVFWPAEWEGRFAIIEVNRRVHGMYLNGGVQLLPEVRIGGGLVYYRTTEELVQRANFFSTEADAELGAAGGAFTYQVSAEIQPIRSIPLTFGIDYKHQAHQELEGEAHFEEPPPALGTSALDQGVSHDLPIYNQLNAGVAYRVVKPLLLTFAYTFDRFVVYNEDLFEGDLGTTILVPRNYKNGQTFRLGAEYDVNAKLQVRAGVLRDLSPTDKEFLSPTIPDANVWAGSVGLSYALPRNVALHAAYFYANYDETTAPVTPDNTVPGTYDSWAQIFSLGVTWRGM